MPTRRKRPVLYEIVRHTRRSRDVGWRDKRFRADTHNIPPVDPLRASPAAGEPPTTAPNSPHQPVSAPNPDNWPDLPDAANPAGSIAASLGRSIRFVDGRLLLDVAWPGMTVAAVMAIVLLALAFQIGRRYAQPPKAASGTEQFAPAENADPAGLLPRESRPVAPGVPVPHAADNVHVALPPAAPPTAEPVPQPAPMQAPSEQEAQPAFDFQKGYDYIVVQYFPLQHKETAFDAARFLQANGVSARVLVKKADVELVATEPFLLHQKDRAARAAAEKACDALKQRIRTLGREFARQQAAARKPQYALDQPAERLWLK